LASDTSDTYQNSSNMENTPDLTPYYQLVENVITKLGVDPSICRSKDGNGEIKAGQWNMLRGSAKVWIDLWYIEKEKRAYYQVMSPVMQIPENNKAALFQELLEINDKLYGVAFTIYNNWVWLKVIREVDGMDENEAFAMLTRIGNYADQYDDHLIGKYGEESGDDNPAGPAPSDG